MNEQEKQCDAFDAAGILPHPGENVKDYLARAEQEAACGAAHALLRDPYFVKNGAEPIPQDVLREGAKVTEPLYGFSAVHVPGVFLKHGFGIFWGGCTLTDDQGTAVFALRENFRRKKKWFLYDRAELLAHEQCHAARTPLNDREQEEFFAYQTSRRRLRRYLGNCFRSKLDGVLFLAGLIPLFAAEGAMFVGFLPMDFPLLPFFLFAFLYPAFALIRNHAARSVYFKAEQNLRSAGIANPGAVLFRATSAEIRKLAGCGSVSGTKSLLDELQETELRWQIALRRFS